MNQPCGLLIIGKYPAESVPLEKLEVYGNIVNNCADVLCKFTYRNTSPELVDACFVFPLEGNSAVYELEAVIGTKRLVAKCRERAEAEATYKEAVETGHTAFMMQENDTMGDTFQMKLGNIPPNESVLLTFKYAITLELREVDTKLDRFKGLKHCFVNCFTMPAKIGERYDPNHGKDETFEQKSGRLAGKMSFTADIYTDGRLFSVTSAQDKFSVQFNDVHKRSAKVSLVGEFDFSHDFEMELAYEDSHVLGASCEPGLLGESGFLGMHCVAASFLPDIDQSAPSDGNKFEIIFLIDRSGSMEGARIKKAKQALLLFLKSLPKSCRFQVIGFGSTYEKLFPEPVDYTKANLKTALGHQASMNADMGGTEVLEALLSVYNTPITGEGWYRQIILLTDGDVFNQDKVIGLVKSKQTEARLFAMGLGDAVSTSLLWGLARAGRGTAAFIRDDENLGSATMALLKASLQPMASAVSLAWNVEHEGAKVDVFTVPRCLPPLFAGNYMTAFGLVPIGGGVGDSPIEGSKLQGTLTLSFTFNGTQHSLVTPIGQQVNQSDLRQNLGLHRLAAKSQLLELIDQHSSVETAEVGKDTEVLERKTKLRKDIVSISTNANVISPFTSFIGVDPDMPDNHTVPQRSCQFAHSEVRLRGGSVRMAMRSAPQCGGSVRMAMRSAPQCGAGLQMKKSKCAPPMAQFSGAPPMAEFSESDEIAGCGASPMAQFSDSDDCESSVAHSLTLPAHQQDSKASPIAVDNVVRAAELQDFDGFWNLDEDVASLLNVKLSKLKASKPANVTNVKAWATALVVFFLQTSAPTRAQEWEMVVQKALDWLQAGGAWGHVSDLLEAAKATLTPAV